MFVCERRRGAQCEVQLTDKQRDEYVHLWRYIGALLGIEDKYNIAVRRDVAERCFDEFLSSVPSLRSGVALASGVA